MPPLNHFATFCVKTVMGKAHSQGKVTSSRTSHSVHAHLYITVQAPMLLFLNLMWHLKDYGIFRKPQSSGFGGYLAESNAVIEDNCCLQAVVNASY